MKTSGELWRFEVSSLTADRVFLVKECLGGISTWIAMAHEGRGLWSVNDHVTSGGYRFRYYIAEGSTFINCGETGLVAKRLTSADPHVDVQLDSVAIPA